jgi:hypothetical protein
VRGLGPVLLLLSLCSVLPARAETRTEIRLLASYQSGEFATPANVGISSLTAVFAVISERHELTLSMPYLSISSDEPVTFAGDQVIERAGGGERTESGPGDFRVEEEYFVTVGGGARPWVSALFQLKLPVADESKGLGSGETDAGGGVGLTQPLGDRWHLLGRARYIVRGDPPGDDYRNTLHLSLGLQRRLSDDGSASLLYERRQSVLRDRSDLTELYLGYDRGLARRVNLRAGIAVGLSDTAADYGFTMGFSVH